MIRALFTLGVAIILIVLGCLGVDTIPDANPKVRWALKALVVLIVLFGAWHYWPAMP
jgi:hypothetical protein